MTGVIMVRCYSPLLLKPQPPWVVVMDASSLLQTLGVKRALSAATQASYWYANITVSQSPYFINSAQLRAL